MSKQIVNIPVTGRVIKGDLLMPENPKGLILQSYGSVSNRLSPKSKIITRNLFKKGFASLCFDLLSREEERDLKKKYDLSLLTSRIQESFRWIKDSTELPVVNVCLLGPGKTVHSTLKAVSYLGASTKAALSVWKGSRYQIDIFPTVMIVNEADGKTLKWNRYHFNKIIGRQSLKIILQPVDSINEFTLTSEISDQIIEGYNNFVTEQNCHKENELINESY